MYACFLSMSMKKMRNAYFLKSAHRRATEDTELSQREEEKERKKSCETSLFSLRKLSVLCCSAVSW